MITSFLSALALVLVFEGIVPFISPDRFRKMLEKIVHMDDRSLRMMSLVSMVIGVILLYVVHGYLG